MKGTLNLRLSLEGPPPIPNVYQRRHFVWGGVKEFLNGCACRR